MLKYIFWYILGHKKVLRVENWSKSSENSSNLLEILCMIILVFLFTRARGKNDCLDLKMCKDKFFAVGKPMMKSKIQKYKILTPFVTSRTPKMTQNGPKNT